MPSPCRNGCRVRAHDGDAILAEIHLGIDDPFRPASKAHPSLVCDPLGEWEAAAERIERGEYELSWVERDTFEGYVRFHARDGFGNRIKVMTPAVQSTERL